MVSERWVAAVELQRHTAAAIDALSPDDAGDEQLGSLVNAATSELHRAWRDSGARVDEWSEAYGMHRAALFRRQRRMKLHRARVGAVQLVEDARRVWPMAVAGGAV